MLDHVCYYLESGLFCSNEWIRKGKRCDAEECERLIDSWDYDAEEGGCDGCGRSDMDSGHCMLCCPRGGFYSPGTEDCDWCPDSDECAELAAERW